MSYEDDARRLVQNLSGRMSPSPYDTAWLARLRSPNNDAARWPDLIDWLLQHQNADGSWGGAITYYHDRIICTLAAVVALRKNAPTPQGQAAVKRAEYYLWHHLHLLPRDPVELVGFELIFPTLMDSAQTIGADVPYHTCGYGEIQSAKIRLIPPEMLYSPRVSTVHSLEFLGRSADLDRLRAAQASNGSLGNSPATTAYYLLLNGYDERAIAYLDDVQSCMGHVNIVYPFRTFNVTWVLNNLSFSGHPITEFAGPEIWDGLASEVEPNGVGADASFGIPDGDTSSVCIKLLLNAGYAVDPLILARFEDKKRRNFRTYDYERNASVGTNVHALEALHLMTDYPGRREVQEQVILMLLGQRKFDMYWIDKWHASPYYATAHAVVGLLQGDFFLDFFCRPTIEWLLHAQHSDGGWGFFEQSTAEETAYALTTLLYYNRYKPVDGDVLHRGAAYVQRALHETDSAYPPLWIEKCLYMPHDIVRSALLTALIMYEDAFGRSP